MSTATNTPFGRMAIAGLFRSAWSGTTKPTALTGQMSAPNKRRKPNSNPPPHSPYARQRELTGHRAVELTSKGNRTNVTFKSKNARVAVEQSAELQTRLVCQEPRRGCLPPLWLCLHSTRRWIRAGLLFPNAGMVSRASKRYHAWPDQDSVWLGSSPARPNPGRAKLPRTNLNAWATISVARRNRKGTRK